MKIEYRDENQNMRLDSFLASQIQDLSRRVLKGLIDTGDVRVCGKKVKASHKLSSGDFVEVNRDALKEIRLELSEAAEDSPLLASDLDLKIIYEDEYLLAINKPSGMVVHPAPGHKENTLANALLFHYEGKLSDLSGHQRPGIVHRLDRDTSGALLIAKDNKTHLMLTDLFARHEIKREYYAICKGVFADKKGIINLPIGRHKKNRQKNAVDPEGKAAMTVFELIDSRYNFSLLKLELKTGRTHQIRVHLSEIGHPVLGDQVYGGIDKRIKTHGQALHAYRLSFKHPRTNRDIIIRADFPREFTLLLKDMGLGEKDFLD